MSDVPVPIPPQELLQQADFLRAIARGLLGEEHASEDVVQTTWLEALRRRGEPLASPRAWLARVTRNLALDRRRTETRLAARERACARPEALPSVADTLARESVLRSVTDAVLALEEPYRSVILWRYFENVELGAIAERTGEPLATVRSRHARALERLRVRLDRTHGEREAWALGLAGLLGRGAGAPAESGFGTIAPGSIARGTGKAMIVMSKGKVAALVLLSSLLLFGAREYLARERAPFRAPAPVLGSTEASAQAVELVAPEAGTGGVPGRERGSVEPARPATHGSLRVHVAWSDGEPAAGVLVAVHSGGGTDTWLEQDFVRTDGSGGILLAAVAPGEVSLFGDRGGNAWCQVLAGEESRAELVLPAGLDVRGRVVDVAGALVADAEICITSPVNTGESLAVARSDAAGRFSLRALGGGRWVGARKAGYGPSPELYPGALGRELPELRLVLQREGAAVRVIVRDPEGKPAAGARVRFSVEVPDGPNGNRSAREGYAADDPAGADMQSPGETRLVCDAQGVCEAPCLVPGELEVVAVAPGCAPARTSVELPPGARRALELTLERGVLVRGTVRDTRGAPIAGARVRAGEATALERSTRSGTDGGYALENVPSGTIGLVAALDEAGRASTTMRGPDGATLTWDPRLEVGLVLEGRVVDERGQGLAGLELSVFTGDASPGAPHAFLRRTKSAADGSFRVLDCPEAPLRLEARLASAAAPLPVAILEGVQAGAEPVEVRVPDVGMPSAALVGRVLGVNRKPVLAEIGIQGPTGSPLRVWTDETGEFRIELAPGRYALTARGQGNEGLHREDLELTEGRTLDLGALELGGPGRLLVEWSAGSAPERSSVLLLTRDPTPHLLRNLTPAELETGIELPAGAYQLAPTHAGFEMRPFTITADTGTRLQLGPR